MTTPYQDKNLQPQALLDLLKGLMESRLLLLHLSELYGNLPTLIMKTTAQPDAVWAGYQALTVQNPLGLLDSCCFLPDTAQTLQDTYTPAHLISYLAGLTFHYLAQLPANDFSLVPNLTPFKQLCQTFIVVPISPLALQSPEINVGQAGLFAKPAAIEPCLDSQTLMKPVDKHMLASLKPTL